MYSDLSTVKFYHLSAVESANQNQLMCIEWKGICCSPKMMMNEENLLWEF